MTSRYYCAMFPLCGGGKKKKKDDKKTKAFYYWATTGIPVIMALIVKTVTSYIVDSQLALQIFRNFNFLS